MKIRKHKIWPLILFAILSTFITVLLGTEYIAALTIDNYQKENTDYKREFENVTYLIENEINDLVDSLQSYALILSNAYTNQNDKDISTLINTMKRSNLFGELMILTEENVPESITDGLILRTNNSLSIYSYIPSTNGYLCGVIFNEKVSQYIKDLIKNEDSDIYILDKEKNAIFSTKEGDFAYSSIEPKDFYSENNNYYGIKNQLYKLIDSEKENDSLNTQKETLSLPDLFRSLKEYISLSESESYIWYEIPITINNLEFTVLTSKKATFTEETIITSMQASLIVGIVIVICFVLWIFFIIYQGLSNRRLYKVAFIDPVTRHNNAAKFVMETNKKLRKHKKLSYALVLLDIDNFKLINDIYGYENGNSVLKNICDSIRMQLKKKETCTRYTSDEFMILLTYEQETEFNDRLLQINQYILSRTTIPNLKLSYGAYFVQDYTLSVEQMSIYAGMAKDTIKGLKEQFIGYFNESIRLAMIRDKELENASELAFANKEFKVYLQPKYNAITNEIGGAEALVRWISPTLGFISPGDFIPLFEKNHMIITLDNYMLEEVCRQQRKWMEEGKNLVTISVNISRIHLSCGNLLEHVLSIVDRYEVPHQFIELELTESAFFDGKEQLLNIVSELQENNFLVSMDDFGSGYSSLNSLKDLPLDVIKLDGEFFRTSNNIERSETVIRDTINLAKHLQMKIVAEGVETKEQVDFLNGIGCDLIQGFYFAKPMPVREFEEKYYQ